MIALFVNVHTKHMHSTREYGYVKQTLDSKVKDNWEKSKQVKHSG